MIYELPRYPRTFHLAGSKGIVDPKSVPFACLRQDSLVVEEKLDGSCVSIGFLDGQAQIHHRNTPATSFEFDLLKRFISVIETELYCALGERYIMYGEWMLAKHTIFYDSLNSFFFEYDVYDREAECFLGTKERYNLLCSVPLSRVPIVRQYRPIDGENLIKASQHHLSAYSYQPESKLRSIVLDDERELAYSDVTGLSEGFYIKEEVDGKVVGRYKLIRASFVSKILESNHWNKRQFVFNQLSDSRRERWLALLGNAGDVHS